MQIISVPNSRIYQCYFQTHRGFCMKQQIYLLLTILFIASFHTSLLAQISTKEKILVKEISKDWNLSKFVKYGVVNAMAKDLIVRPRTSVDKRNSL